MEHHMATVGGGGGLCGVGHGGGGGGGGGSAAATADSLHLGTIMGLTYSAFQQLMGAPSASAGAARGGGGGGGAGTGSGGGGLTVAAAAAHHHPAHILNPIDRLYSMQNAYFRCDEPKFQGNDDDMGN